MSFGVAVALMAAATAASAVASYESGRMQKKAADVSARLAEQQAANERRAAEIRAENYRAEADRRMATMRAQYAASGVTMEGTPLITLMNTARNVEKDVSRIKWGGEARANAFEGEAGLQRMIGKQKYAEGVMGAGTTLLTGASKIGGMSYQASIK